MEGRTIPAFYCCYLLRSNPPTRSVYVGSTPNPRRRLQQHNTSTSGAKRTRSKELRPWSMDCIVTGFPSKLAALQFEWAWQNTHVTKRLPANRRPKILLSPEKSPKKNLRGKKGPQRPKLKLDGQLKNLHLLCQVPSFARWPLRVRIFSAEVWDKWKCHAEKLDEDVRPSIDVVLDLNMEGDLTTVSEKFLNKHEKGKRRRQAIGKGGIAGLDVGYTSMLEHIAKSNSIVSGNEVAKCAVCDQPNGQTSRMCVICPQENCNAISHMACLAKSFLTSEESEHPVLPISGQCPSCGTETRWIDLVKEMTLRARGEDEVAQLMKKPGKKKFKANTTGNPTALEPQSDASDEEEADEVPDEPLADNWLPQEDDEDDLKSAVSVVSAPSTPTKISAKSLPTVIEDSEWDDAEALS